MINNIYANNFNYYSGYNNKIKEKQKKLLIKKINKFIFFIYFKN